MVEEALHLPPSLREGDEGVKAVLCCLVLCCVVWCCAVLSGWCGIQADRALLAVTHGAKLLVPLEAAGSNLPSQDYHLLGLPHLVLCKYLL